MIRVSAVAAVGALIGDPGRAAMLEALMDGRALTATELSALAGVTPQTASAHLAKLAESGLITVERQGRHRYHRLASGEVAALLEQLARFAERPEGRPRRALSIGPKDAAMRAARSCYDHLAGRLAVDIADALTERGHVELDQDGGVVTASGERVFQEIGLDLAPLRRAKRAFCRPCLDWSERRPHLAGAVGAALACRCFELGWVKRVQGSRAVSVTPAGRDGFLRAFGVAPR
ncbi:MAG: ArsR/SmtB family transcription factor [Elsteraceae bacterium]